ncbi:hypothetical protein [Mesorhizobium sp. M7A.F.Ca.MR.176.00.0.0]|uniref:hypothetical protein n=1 Tax=Mesorhizobium sp. M7A.F.Ca.MR.176.00.0.0 TaxID=2496776 RepID=UPI001FE120B8|nr:hypothetical protein [Mesorhizobium sp. M7A.F.Ca.MR.176.00.0.0]
MDDHINSYGGTSLSAVFKKLFGQPSLENLTRWYHSTTLNELQRLIDSLETARTSQFCKVVGFTMISAIARSLSSETRSWGHIADNVKPREFVYKDVQRAALSWLQRTQKRLAELRRAAAPMLQLPKFEFRLVDWTTNQPSFPMPSAALLITSPPYGGAIDYGLAQRLSLYLLGLSDESIAGLVSAEIGARRKRFKPRHVDVWAEELVNAVGAQVLMLDIGAYAAFVMPHKDHGRDAGELLLKEVLSQKGWKLEFSADRSVRQSRTRQSWTSIKKETILVFRGG